MALEDVVVGAGDGGEGRIGGEGENERVVKAAGTLQHGAAPAAPPQHRHGRLPAGGEVHLDRRVVAVSDDDEVFG
jgi:hypothetical protein